MAKKSRKRSAKARAAKRAHKRTNRAARKGVEPAGLKAYRLGLKSKHAGKRAGKKAGKRSKSRSVRAKSRKIRRKNKRRSRSRSVAASPGTVVRVYKTKRGKVRKFRASRARGRKSYGVVGVNPGSMTLLGGITGGIGNVQSTFKGGMKSWALAGAGAAGAVFAGTLLSRLTLPLIASTVPVLISNPIGARAFGAANYYVSGWALSKFVPGLSPRTRRAMFAGSLIAAALELIKPGIVRNTAASIPIIGPVFGQKLEGLADDLGAYVNASLGGLRSDRDDEAGRFPDEIAGDETAGLASYALPDGTLNDVHDSGVGDGVGAYAYQSNGMGDDG